ncbi:putative coat protein [Heterobasidion partitivirus 2]|uniref:Putative coat protein n=1 Tax=Heterobasidion partitivirus 2 TaxID=872291 RepID=E1AB82_9VIRU|nr:putative coat protein [Heterobasidion partitivirus 2]ADL66906.1 putative coat protein [Heterobasidion partitivirus 2]
MADKVDPPRDVVAETPPVPQPASSGRTVVKQRHPAQGAPTISLAKVLDLESDVHKGKGTYHSGSYVPDVRFFVLSLCTYYGRVFSATDYEASQFVTPPSLIAYSLFCLYFLLFYRDMHSKSPSQYARTFTDFGRYNQLLKLMDEVYIPDEIFELLKVFSVWSPELIPNLQFVPSLGSTLPLYDIPYLMHPAIFLHGHNTLFNRADAVGHYARFLRTELFSINSASLGNAARIMTIGNLIGCAYTPNATQGSARLIQNWLSNAILPFVDPATHRQHLRRTGLAKYDLGLPTFTSANWNPYTFLFSSNVSSSFESFIDCAHACSEFSRDQLKASRHMSDLYSQVSPAPGSYMIQSYSTPTWHATSLPSASFPDGEITRGDFDTLHTTYTFFGIAPAAATANSNNLHMPEVRQNPATATSTLIGFVPNAYLIEQHADPDVAVPQQLSLIDRNEMKHTRPNILVFAPGDSTVSAAQWPILTGIVVHNGNIDSNVIKAPNPDDDLPQIRSRYVDGFVSLRVIRPRFANRPTWLIARQALERVSYSTINFLWRSDLIAVPRFDAAHNAPAAGGITGLLWPFTFFRRVTQMIFGTNVAVSDSPTDPTVASHKQVGDAWSSFRLTSDSNAVPSVENTYFGINHGEIIFGRNSTLNKFSHPSDLLRRN